MVERSQVVSHMLVDKMVPGSRVDLVACKEVPGDEPIVYFINTINSLKAAPGITVSKFCYRTKIQVCF